MNTLSAAMTAITAFSCSTVVVAGDLNAKLAEEFVKSVQDAGQVLDKAGLQVRYEMTTDVNKVGRAEQITDRHKGEVAIRPGMALSRSGSSVRAANQEYSFVAQRVGDKYVLMDDATRDNDKSVLRNAIHLIRHGVLSAYDVSTVQLSDLVSSDGFKMKGASRVGDNVEILFEHSQYGRIGRISEGCLLCAPSKNWAILEYSATFHHSGGVEIRFTGENTIGASANGITFAEQAKTTIVRPDKKQVFHQVQMVTVMKTDVPRDQFFLTHYGITEPKR